MPSRIEFARELFEDDEERVDDPFYHMMVISNEKHFRGSAALFYPGNLEKISMALGGNFYIIPSSVHEVLAIPDDPSIVVLYLQELVAEANLMYVSENERLSDSVYYYDANSGEVIRTEPGSDRLS